MRWRPGFSFFSGWWVVGCGRWVVGKTSLLCDHPCMSVKTILVVLVLCLSPLPAAARSRADGRYIVTAYSTAGETASGDLTHRRIAAADPRILPLGSRIRISGAGSYSGEYTVSDTGPKIQGRKLDIFIPSAREAKRFGKRRVRVKVIELGQAK
jgi:3D (Asp-Asp-Asp) domain-containing protein